MQPVRVWGERHAGAARVPRHALSGPVDAARPTDIYDPDGVKALDQSLFLPGHSVENLAHSMHGNDENLSVVEFPTRHLSKKAGEWALKMSISIQ